VQEVGISSGTPPIARRPEGTSRFDLIFEGTRDAKVRDRHTRVHISLPSTLAAQLWRQGWARSSRTGRKKDTRDGPT
jgi:hypothetical protein